MPAIASFGIAAVLAIVAVVFILAVVKFGGGGTPPEL